MENKIAELEQNIKNLQATIRRLENKCTEYAAAIQKLEEMLVQLDALKNSKDQNQRFKYHEVNLDYAATKVDLGNTKVLIYFKQKELERLKDELNRELQNNMPQPE